MIGIDSSNHRIFLWHPEKECALQARNKPWKPVSRQIVCKRIRNQILQLEKCCTKSLMREMLFCLWFITCFLTVFQCSFSRSFSLPWLQGIFPKNILKLQLPLATNFCACSQLAGGPQGPLASYAKRGLHILWQTHAAYNCFPFATRGLNGPHVVKRFGLWFPQLALWACRSPDTSASSSLIGFMTSSSSHQTSFYQVLSWNRK